MSLALARAWIAAHRNDDGSFGYLPGQEGQGEPTLLAAAAGIDVGLDWLAAADLGWSRLLLPAALSRVAGAASLREEALAWIVEARGEVVEASFPFDPTIPAWSWFPETAPWVEPTAYAVLSLRRCGLGDHPRCLAGIRMLLDRQCDDGGWNYGNPGILGARLEGYLPATGWALLALPASDATERGLGFLSGALEMRSATTLSLAILAHVAHGRDPAPFVGALRDRQAPDGHFGGRVDWTALAACALDAADHGGGALLVPPEDP